MNHPKSMFQLSGVHYSDSWTKVIVDSYGTTLSTHVCMSACMYVALALSLPLSLYIYTHQYFLSLSLSTYIHICIYHYSLSLYIYIGMFYVVCMYAMYACMYVWLCMWMCTYGLAGRPTAPGGGIENPKTLIRIPETDTPCTEAQNSIM